ncbi:shikimate 5-dehydrogenase [Streptomyces pseudovenezuelae]|uniref:Shikimate 5-dehydrogenase n=1 Tax=Streptomyces pseudovenezuelae TaxID=67350 RepID=A0ABT6LDI7_9ACTN|nr:shikimate 5-dehydrogenase [Streptomyces pseudovenezuelae]
MTQDSYLIGLIGSGTGTSFSPMLHEREADRHGLRYLYRLIDLDRIGIGCLDELTPQAEAVGAVNTVVSGCEVSVAGGVFRPDHCIR